MHQNQLITTISRVAATQHGLIRVDQIAPADRRRANRLVDNGLLERCGHGVLRVVGSPATWMQALTAGAWSLGTGAVVSHLAAAQLLQLDGFDDERLEYIVPRAKRNRRVAGAHVHSVVEPIQRRDVLTIQGLPTTGATRTIVDLARIDTAIKRLERAVDSALSLRISTLPKLIDRVEAIDRPASRGVARLTTVLVSSGGHSFLERRFLELIRHAGLPLPETQVVHRMDGRHLARVDFLFASHNLVVEVSGGRGHSSAADRARDAERRNGLQQLGRMVLEFTYEMIISDEARVLATVAAALASRGR